MSDDLSKIVNCAHVVMVVDDEEMVTQTLTAYLTLETDYEVLPFQSPEEALETLKTRRVDIVISDFLMPDMDGLQFLTEVKKITPDATLILLTGYADKENAIKGINEVGLFQYIEKPWDNEDLKLTIRNGIQNKNLREVLQIKIRELDRVLLERDKLSLQNEMMQEELLLARNVQQSMLPEAFPEVNGIAIATRYLPALEIGGDLYDVIALAEDKIAVLVADVTGHGIQAALITSVIKSSFSAFKDHDAKAGDILIFMNRVLEKILPRAMFAAATVVVIDTKNGHCHISNAGIPQPVLVNRREKVVQQIPATGLLLGIADERTFEPGEEIAFQLKKGELLLLFTDGLSEVPNEQDERFDSRMQDALMKMTWRKGSEVIDYLIKVAQDFSKKDHEWDDVAILGIENQAGK